MLVLEVTDLAGLAGGELKLRGMFITGLADGDRESDLQLVRATIELGHTMGHRVVAECIEDEATLDFLAELGCDYRQEFSSAGQTENSSSVPDGCR